MEPRFGQALFASDGGGGKLHCLGDLFDGESPEEAELDDLAFAFVEGRERLERGIEIDNHRACLRGERQGFIERNVGEPVAAFLRILAVACSTSNCRIR